jgi:biopolymer transport protein ExbD
MGMNVGTGGGSEPEVMIEMNTTPLIDVMLVLLVMLIITIPIQLHAVNMNLPTGNPPPQVVEPEVVRVEVDFDGTVLWNGTPLNGRAELEARLTEVAARNPQPELHLRPHRLVVYDAVATVLASADRLGVTKIGIIGNEQFAN